MTIQWTTRAVADLSRLHEFLAVRNPDAAARAVQALVDAPVRLLQNPRIGERVVEFEPREVRRVLVGGYELRYEITESRMYVLRIWHTRKERDG